MTFTSFLYNVSRNLAWDFWAVSLKEIGLFSFISGTLLSRVKILAGLWHGSLIQKNRKFRGCLDPSSLYGANTTVLDCLLLDFFIYLNYR